MATFTITTAVNIDTLASKAGSDTYNINGGYLTVDQDTRYGTNQNTSAAMGNITLSATLGGTIEFNSTQVRLIPYDTGTGNVPTLDTIISKGGASGILIGVYDSLAVAPTTAGSAMPANGYIKIRQWNNVAYTSGALTGISANATGADTPGWLEIVGVDVLTCIVNRLNTFKVRGDWFELGTTDGTRATTYQIPSNGSSAFYLPGVWVETAVASGEYEFYPCAGSLSALAASMATDAIRGKFCWISTTGLLRFGHDGTNSTGGYLPVSGLNIRIPNIFFMCCTAVALTVNVLPNATITTRYEFATTGGGAIDIDTASLNWYLNLNQPFSVALTNVGIMSNVTLTECASPIAWSQVGIGQEAATSQFGLTMSLNFAGGSMANCTFTRALLAATGNYVVTMTDCTDFTMTNLRICGMATRGNATTGAMTLIRMSDSTWTNTTIGDGRMFMTTCTDLTITDSIYYDHPATTTTSTNAMYTYDLSTVCTNIVMNGLTFGGLTLCQPYNGILQIGAAACNNIKLRNLGTYASPLDLGDTRQDDVNWTRVTTVATITKTAHGLKTGDIVYVIVSNVVAAITVAAKTIASTPTADTFTFACLNAGATSGTLSYFPTMSANLFVLAVAAAANGVYIQRCYVPHTRTNTFTADNSSKNLLISGVLSDFVNAPLTAALNGTIRAIGSTLPLTAQTSVYGTHWFDGYTNAVAVGTSGNSWTRVTTTATVTSADHGMRTGNVIVVTISGDTAAIILGTKTVTVLTSSTFTFTCLNAGGASGTLSFDPCNGRIGVLMNEPTADTTSQAQIEAGGAAFTSAGGLFMPNSACSRWSLGTAAEANTWTGIAWSPELSIYVGVASSGTNRVMYSSDGITWNTATAAEANSWTSVCWSSSLGIFVAVSSDGTNQVMYSSNGTSWSSTASAEQNNWNCVIWAASLSGGTFVAVASSGTNRVMTSTDGTTWTPRAASQANSWVSVAWSPSLSILLAVSSDGTNRAMSSPTGATWTNRTPETNSWRSVDWSPQLALFVAVASDGTNRAFSSTNGTSMTARTAAAQNAWYAVAWCPGMNQFVGVSRDGTNMVMVSLNGTTWTAAAVSTPTSGTWAALAESPAKDKVIAVANDGSLMTSGAADQALFETDRYILGHTTFSAAESTMAGGTIGNYDIFYALDRNDGNGFDTFHNMYYVRGSSAGTSGQNTISVGSSYGVEVDDYVWGTGIAGLAQVVSISGNTITLTSNNTATVSGAIRFSRLGFAPATDASVGFKLKIRIKTRLTNATAITSLYHFTISTETSRAYQYALDSATITLTNIIPGSRYEIYNRTSVTTLTNAVATTNTATVTASAANDDNLRIRVRKSNDTTQASTYTWSANVITVTFSSHGLYVGEPVNLEFTSGDAIGQNGTFTVASTPTSSTYTVALTGSGTGGNADSTRIKYLPIETGAIISSLSASAYISQIEDIIA